LFPHLQQVGLRAASNATFFDAFLAQLPHIMAQKKERAAKKRDDKQKRTPHHVTPDYVAEQSAEAPWERGTYLGKRYFFIGQMTATRSFTLGWGLLPIRATFAKPCIARG
jgi:hypothetical protein